MERARRARRGDRRRSFFGISGKPRADAYVFGGAAVAFGILQFTGYLLRPSSSEQIWRQYSDARAGLLAQSPSRYRLSQLQLRVPAAPCE